MNIFTNKILYLLGSLIFLIFVYFFGYSNGETVGYQQGYKVCLEEYKPKYELAVDSLNNYIKESNEKIHFLQEEADKAYTALKEYESQECPTPILSKEEQTKPSFSSEMIKEINRLLEK